jgi:hypothetical protein
MNYLLNNIGFIILIFGIVYAISSIYSVMILSANEYQASVMTPISNIKKLKELSRKRKEYIGLYYMALYIGYGAVITLILFIAAMIYDIVI